MTLQQIYADKKQVINDAYAKMYNKIRIALDEDEEYQLDTDSENDLILDLMLSNILGTITSFDKIHRLLELSPDHVDIIRKALDGYAHSVHEDVYMEDIEKETTQNIIKDIEAII